MGAVVGAAAGLGSAAVTQVLGFSASSRVLADSSYIGRHDGIGEVGPPSGCGCRSRSRPVTSSS
eukprot:10513477-Alexandrium_andersonii.AAC.1